jgi:hypothetical protein
MSMKNSNDTIRKRTRDLPACSAVPQPTAPPCALVCMLNGSCDLCGYLLSNTHACREEWQSLTKVGTKFSETAIMFIIKFTHVVGTSFTKLRLYFHKVCFTSNTLFPPLRGATLKPERYVQILKKLKQRIREGFGRTSREIKSSPCKTTPDRTPVSPKWRQ